MINAADALAITKACAVPAWLERSVSRTIEENAKRGETSASVNLFFLRATHYKDGLISKLDSMGFSVHYDDKKYDLNIYWHPLDESE